MAYLQSFLFILLYFIAGLVFINIFLKDKLPKSTYIYIAPAIGLIFISLTAFFAYYLHAYILIPLSILIIAILAIIRWKFIFYTIKRLDKLSIFTLIIFVLILFLQIFIYQINKTNDKAVSNTWQVYKISGVSPPDQAFSWNQARFFKENLKYGTDPFYGDIDLLDRPVMGGFITYYALNNLNLSSTDIDNNFSSNYQFIIYMITWWSLNNLYIFGVALVSKKIFGTKKTYLAVLIAALAPVPFLIGIGLWVKFLPVYFFALALYFHIKRKFPIFKGILCASAFLLHSSMIIFIIPLFLEDVFHYISIVLKTKKLNKKGLTYILKIGITIGFIIGGWLGLLKVLNAPQSLTFAYQYDADWTELVHSDENTLKERFNNSTNTKNLILLPIVNTIKSAIPQEALTYINNFTYQQKDYFEFDRALGVMSLTEFKRVGAILGLFLFPFVVIGTFMMFFDKKFRRFAVYLYILPTIIVAILYRKNDIFSNHITTAFALISIISIIYLISKVKYKKILAATVILLVLINHILSVIFSPDRFSSMRPLYLNSENQFDMKWIIYIVIISIASLITYYLFSKKRFNKTK